MPQRSTRRLISLLSSVALVATLFVASLPAVASAAEVCYETAFIRDGNPLTAAQIGGNVTGTLDATTCNIGVYYGPGTTGSVNEADIFGANYFGVLVNGATVNVTNSSVHDIGETPINGAQHGNAIAYVDGSTGTVSGNTVVDYQKGGIVASGLGVSVSITRNTVTGAGPVDFIAQNGIQVSYGASATVTRNTVSGNNYTPKAWLACGLLFYQANGVKASGNTLFANEKNTCNFGKGGGNVSP